MTRLRVLELFAGIGGCAAALHGAAEVVAAVDVNRKALAAYRENFSHPIDVRAIESIAAETLAAWNADLWWMSPPCQPYTTRGHRRDTSDPRALSLLNMLEQVALVKPRYLALENVPGFQGSNAHTRLLAVLSGGEYTVREILLCPTQLGIPNRRRRYYCVASRERLDHWAELRQVQSPIAWHDVLEAGDLPEFHVASEMIAAYNGAVHVVSTDDARAVSCCFTSGYGRSIAASGSYLRTGRGHRRFSPTEILRLLGFPSDYRLPAKFAALDSWRLLGNSLSIPAVRYALSCIPELRALVRKPGAQSTLTIGVMP